MKVEKLAVDGYHGVYKFTQDDFLAYISLHNLNLGPGIGGCRLLDYGNPDAALTDVLRLSKAMSFKNSLAGIKYGGAKMVVNGHPSQMDEALLEKIGACVNHLEGQYITGTDLGTSLEDMHRLANYTKWVEEGRFGDTAIYTALGIYSCISAMELRCPSEMVNVWVEGVGKVGMELVRLLSEDSWFNIYVTDIDETRIKQAVKDYNVQVYRHGLNKAINVYAPCARGHVITHDNVHKFWNTVICGGANNQLASDDLSKALLKQESLYCPDYLVNAGGVVTIAAELEGWTEAELREYVEDRANLLYSLSDMCDYMDVDLLTLTNFIAEQRMKND